MRKIKDRFLLGVISGLGGNMAKTALEIIFVMLGLTNETGIKKASGIFLRKRAISTPLGKTVGIIGDNMIASILGISCTYVLTLTGKDFYILKGAGLGAIEWTSLYGVLSKFGATNYYPTKAKDALLSFVSHLTFGGVKIFIARHLGDEQLFKPHNIDQDIKEQQELKLVKN